MTYTEMKNMVLTFIENEKANGINWYKIFADYAINEQGNTNRENGFELIEDQIIPAMCAYMAYAPIIDELKETKIGRVLTGLDKLADVIMDICSE
jgi:hypothetical protein